MQNIKKKKVMPEPVKLLYKFFAQGPAIKGKK